MEQSGKLRFVFYIHSDILCFLQTLLDISAQTLIITSKILTLKSDLILYIATVQLFNHLLS